MSADRNPESNNARSETPGRAQVISCAPMESEVDSKTVEFYRNAIILANESGIPFLVGGSYAFNCYTGIRRKTKDFDFFVHPRDVRHIMEVFSGAGYITEITSIYWLGKIFSGEDFIDVIFGSGKGINDIDDEWFSHSVGREMLGQQVKLCPPEEMIWSKAYIMERGRYDGADIAHLMVAQSESIDWTRLLQRFGLHWRLLLSHLVLFGFIYPSERSKIPEWVMRDLLARLEGEMKSPPPAERICRGTLLSREQYLVDIECWGYKDVRPEGTS